MNGIIDVQKLVDDMRKITMLTGQISTIQETSLKKWCYIAFDDVQEIEIKYDLSKDRFLQTKMGYVDFYIKTTTPDSQQDFLQQRVDRITEWVRDLFWNEIAVSVYINDSLVKINVPELKTDVDLKGETSGLDNDKK